MNYHGLNQNADFSLAALLPAVLLDMLRGQSRAKMPGRGLEYAAQGRVLAMRLAREDSLVAEVQGSGRRPYRVMIDSFDDGSVEIDCSCPVGTDCKHVYAVLYRLAGAALSMGLPWAQPLAADLPEGWADLPPEALPTLKGDGVAQVLGQAEHVRTARRLPAAGVDDAPWWEQFLNAPPVERALILEEAIRAHVAGHFFVPGIQYYLSRFAADLNPLRALLEFQEYATAIPVRVSPRSPIADPAFTAFLNSDAVRAMWQELQAREADLRLLEWLDQSEGIPDASIALEWCLIDAGYDYPVLAYRLLLTAKKLVRAPRHASAVEQLAGDVRNRRRVLRSQEARVVQWLAESPAQPANPSTSPMDTHLRVHSVFEWQAQVPPSIWAWDDGSPVRIAAHPARLAVVPSASQMAWEIDVQPPDGSARIQLDPRRAFLFFERTPALFAERELDRLWLLHEGWVYPLETGGMPLDLTILLLNRRELPVALLREQGLAGRFVQRIQQSGLRDGGLTAQVPARVRVEFHVHGNVLQVAVVAETGEGSCFHYAGRGRWDLRARAAQDEDAKTVETLEVLNAGDVPETEPEVTPPHEAVPEGVLATRPRDEDLAPVEQWLAALLPGTGNPGVTSTGLPSLGYRLDDALRIRLLEHWADRPSGLSCTGNRAMQALVQLRRPPEFKINFSSSGVDWLEVSVSMQEEMAMLTAAEVNAALAQSGQLVQLPRHGTYQRDALEAYQQQMDVLAEMGLEPGSGPQRLHAIQLAGAGLAALEDGPGALKRFADQARAIAAGFKGIPSAKVAKEADAVLRPYQRAGVDFLAWASTTFGGAVLADDMGLGKTLQVLATLTAMRMPRANKKLPSLVVCPASVAHNWQREAARFTPGLKTVVIERGADRKVILEHLDQYDLVIKNYALTRRDSEYLEKQEWLLVCVDEAQAIKNPVAAITKVVKGLRARYRIGLTGTPIENRAMDMWSIADFAVPGHLGTQARFEERVKGDSKALHSYLRARLRPVLLRRLKQDVAPELPPRIEERLDCEMTPKQRQAYLAEMKRARDLLAKRPDPALQGQARIQMLAALTRLRQICCDPRLRGLGDLGSGKMTVLLETLQPLLEAGHKVLVFSQFVEMLKLLEHELTRMDVPYYLLTGKTTRRQTLVEDFEADERPVVFLISLKAGGTGLNLTSASHVVLFDPWWNPAAEAQAIDRTHRIGQDKTVLAFRLVTVNTIEERILQLQEQKRDLVKNILEAESFNRSLTRADFDFLLQEP